MITKIVLWHLILWWKPISHLLKKEGNNCAAGVFFPTPRFSYFGWSNKGKKKGKTLIPLDLRSTRWNFFCCCSVVSAVEGGSTNRFQSAGVYLHDQKCSHHNSWNNFILSSRGNSSRCFGKAKNKIKKGNHISNLRHKTFKTARSILDRFWGSLSCQSVLYNVDSFFFFSQS